MIAQAGSLETYGATVPTGVNDTLVVIPEARQRAWEHRGRSQVVLNGPPPQYVAGVTARVAASPVQNRQLTGVRPSV